MLEKFGLSSVAQNETEPESKNRLGKRLWEGWLSFSQSAAAKAFPQLL